MHAARSAPLGRALLVAVAAMASLPSPSAEAGGPSLAFDFPRTIPCAPGDAGEPEEGQKLVRCVLPLSVRLTDGKMSDVQEIRVEVADCDKRLRVHRFAPITRLESTAAGNIEWTKTTEKKKTFGASLGGESPLPIGDVVARVTPTASAGLSNREVITERQEKLAPKQLVVASGTINDGHGVFFKLRPSSQTTLEGMHELLVEFVAPNRWRGDAIHVTVEATGEERFLWLKQQKRWAQKRTSVALFLQGDPAARDAAEAFIRK